MKKLITLCLFAVSLSVMAQTSMIPDMKFRRLDTPDGLSSSQINNIFKDSRGYVWISTPYGLNRYDGYRVKTFYSNQRDTTTMRDNYCDRIYEAYDGRLWMRQGMGYCVYDPVTESFDRNAAGVLAKMGLNCNIEWMHIDSKKRIWVKEFENGVYCYHPEAKGGKKIVKINMGYAPNEFSPNYGISSVAEMDDRLLVVTFNGELVCLNGEKGEVEWVDPWMRNARGIENQEYRLFVDSNGNVWCNVLSFLYIYERSQKKWYGSINEYLAYRGISDFPQNLQMWSMIVDKDDCLWLGCDHDGLVVVDMKNKQWKQFLNNKHDETSLSDNTLRTLYLDNRNTVWIGTYKNGLNQYIPGVSSLKSIELGDITATCEDKYGNYWLGTNDVGILVYNPKTNEVVNHFTKDNSGLANNIIVGSWPASDGTIWFGSYNGGLSHAIPSSTDPTQATILNIQATGKPGELANNSVWALNEDKWGRIWFSTLGGGLQMLDLKTMKFTTWDSKNTVLPGDYLNSLSWNKKGWLMVGTAYYYSLVNPVTRKLINQVIPENPDIVSPGSTTYVIEDSRGLIWHGSNVGIIVYDQKTKFQTLLDMTDGLLGSSVNSLLEDKKHNIWAVTDHGVSRIVPQQQENGEWQFTVRSYSSADGLQKATYNQRSMWLTRDGKVLIGGQGGLDIIDPSLLQDKKSDERPVFSGLQIFDQDVEVGREFKGRVILDEALDVCRELTLKYNDQFTIQLSTNKVVVNNRKRFAYKLEGFNENWVRTSPLNPNITYNSLRAGSYTLYVRILNGDGTLGEEESQLEITILPPLYRTRWMILLYMLIIAGGAWLFVKWYLKKQKEKADMEQLQREQDKHQWMSEMRAQMMKESQQYQKANIKGDTFEVIHESEVIDDQGFVASTMPKLEVHRSEGDIVAFLKDLCDNYKPLEDKKLKLTFGSPQDSILMAFDKTQIRRAFEILMRNSVKFGPPLCKIQVTVLKPSVDRVAILMADNGVGIPEEHKAHMFEPFLGDESENLGLDKVKQIVDAHHGTIKADDNPGGGTVFTISLPIEDPDVEEAVIIEDE